MLPVVKQLGAHPPQDKLRTRIGYLVGLYGFGGFAAEMHGDDIGPIPNLIFGRFDSPA